MLDPHFVILGAAASLIGSFNYAYLTARGRVRPNRVTWFLWGFAPMIAFFAQLDDGVGLPAISTLAIAVGPLAIFVASFLNRRSYWRITRFDAYCGLMSVLALALWITFDNPVLAFTAALLADVFGGIPTIVKAWRHPETEKPMVYVLGTFNGLLTMASLQEWTFVHYGFPLYLVALGVSLTAIVRLRGRRATARRPRS